MGLHRIATTAAIATVVLAGLPDVADAQDDDGQVIVVPGDHSGAVPGSPSVEVEVIDPGKPGGGSASTGGPGTERRPAPNGSPCVVQGSTGRCVGAIVTGDPSGAALPTPGDLAGQAFDQLRLPLPVPQHSPDVRLSDGSSATVVGEHTWLWTDRSAWAAVTRRVQAGSVWAQVTATPKAMLFDSGMGAGTVCAGPGTPYDRAYGLHAPSPDCGFKYSRSSVGMPDDRTTATYAISWSVTWVGSTGAAPVSGTLPDMRSQATARFAVVEVQALRSK